MLYIYIYITRLASNELFLPSNKVHRKVGRVKDLSAPRYKSPLPDNVPKHLLLQNYCWLQENTVFERSLNVSGLAKIRWE